MQAGQTHLALRVSTVQLKHQQSMRSSISTVIAWLLLLLTAETIDSAHVHGAVGQCIVDPTADGKHARPIVRVGCLLMQGKFFEASAEDIDPKKKLLTVRPPWHQGLSQDAFQISYDTLILSMGSINNTFGIKVRLLSQPS